MTEATEEAPVAKKTNEDRTGLCGGYNCTCEGWLVGGTHGGWVTCANCSHTQASHRYRYPENEKKKRKTNG